MYEKHVERFKRDIQRSDLCYNYKQKKQPQTHQYDNQHQTLD